MPMSNHTSLNDARLDRAIDRAVREMMQVDPAPGLRRRVLSRINAPVERRRSSGDALRVRCGGARRCCFVHRVDPGSRRTACAAESAVTDCCDAVFRPLISAVLSSSTGAVPSVSSPAVVDLQRAHPHASGHKRVWHAAIRRVSGHSPRACVLSESRPRRSSLS